MCETGVKNLSQEEEARLDLIRINRKMTLQPPGALQTEQADNKEAENDSRGNINRKLSAFMPIKDNVSKKSMDEASMFLRNSCLKPEGAVSNGNLEVNGF